MLAVNNEQGGGSRIKEIMVFSDEFVKWADKQVRDQASVMATIMMFSTDEDEEEDEYQQKEKY